MKEKQLCIVVTFYTTAEAMATKQLCQDHHIGGRLISAPRALSSDCGIAWCSDIGCRDVLKNALTEAQIETAGFHEIMI